MRRFPSHWLLSILGMVSLLAACTGPTPTGGSNSPAASTGAAPRVDQNRTLVAAVRLEPANLADRALQQAGVALYLSKRMFNANLALLDEQAQARPYLAESLPQLDTDSWKVSSDGKMETTYKLKPDLVWHDGAPLTADDWVFAAQVYKTPELGLASLAPMVAIDEVTAPDPRTLVIRWNRLYADAGTLAARDRELPPLPRHILQASFQPEQIENFANLPFWTREYVGAGPYKLDKWEPGSYFEATAFDKHVLGRAKISRIRTVFISDANTALANLLTGEVQMAADTALRLEQGVILRQQWAPTNGGEVLEHPNQWRASVPQLRMELAQPKALLDVRVRKALALAVDKEGLNEALYSGTGLPADNIVPGRARYGQAVDAAITKYPFDLRRSEQFMNDAGYRKGSDGFYVHPTEGRFVTEVKTNAAADNEAELQALASQWRQAGFDFQTAVLPAAQSQDAEIRATYTGLFTNNTNVGETTATQLTTSGIPTTANRWRGGNRGGWSSPEYDRLVDVYEKSLDDTTRSQTMAQMMRIFTEDVGSISLFFRTQPWPHAAILHGLQVVAPESNMAWNIHEWEFR